MCLEFVVLGWLGIKYCAILRLVKWQIVTDVSEDISGITFRVCVLQKTFLLGY